MQYFPSPCNGLYWEAEEMWRQLLPIQEHVMDCNTHLMGHVPAETQDHILHTLTPLALISPHLGSLPAQVKVIEQQS